MAVTWEAASSETTGRESRRTLASRAPLISTLHLPSSVTSSQPLHWPGTEPTAGSTLSVTVEPEPNSALQVSPQEIPAGALVIVPAPAPLFETFSGKA